jgi:hypothetical protein
LDEACRWGRPEVSRKQVGQHTSGCRQAVEKTIVARFDRLDYRLTVAGRKAIISPVSRESRQPKSAV